MNNINSRKLSPFFFIISTNKTTYNHKNHSSNQTLSYIRFPCFSVCFFKFFPCFSISMGKYMKKPIPKSESPSPNSTPTPIANSPPTPITNSPPPTTANSSDGIRTRSRTLALQNSNNQNQNLSVSSDSYLQLRNRRLKKSPIRQQPAKRNKGQNGNPKSPIGDSIAEEKTVQKSPEPENAEFGENDGDTERWIFRFLLNFDNSIFAQFFFISNFLNFNSDCFLWCSLVF